MNISMVIAGWLLVSSIVFLKWSLMVYAKLFWITPLRSIATVLSELVNQVSLLIAFLLPLKVIILLGSTGTPRYFPDFLLQYDRDQLAISLSCIAVVSYGIHLLTNKLSLTLSSSAENVISTSTQKLTLFGSQREFTRRAFFQFQGILASMIFSAAAVALLGYFYPTLTGFLAACGLICYLGTSIASRRSLLVRDWLYTNHAKLLNIFSGVIFLLAFAFIVADFVWFVGPNMLTAIIGIVLTRQVVGRLSTSISNAVNLTKQRSKIDMLLFHSKVFQLVRKEKAQGYWSLLAVEQRAMWIEQVISEVHDSQIIASKITWLETRPAGLACFDVEIDSDAGSARYFIKLFNRNLSAQHKQEAMLLNSVRDSGLPAPRLLLETELQGCQCHVMEGLWNPVMEDNQSPTAAVYDLQGAMWQVRPPTELLNSYKRSKPPLSDRITKDHIQRLLLAQNTSEEGQLISKLSKSLQSVRENISALPIAFTNPSINRHSMRCKADGSFVVPNWGQWSLEPIGAGWPCSAKQLDALSDLLKNMPATSRLHSMNPKCAELAALTFEFLKLHRLELYQSAIQLIPKILDTLAAIDAVVPKKTAASDIA